MMAATPIEYRRKVLCLGVSFACLESSPSTSTTVVREQDHEHCADTTARRATSWQEAAQAVERGTLTEMDGRDLARCLATEAACDVDLYTVSQELGAKYRSDRHLYANFARPNFCKVLAQTFPLQFDQVVLDYFWIPPGWNTTHWTKTFFDCTLPGLRRHRLLSETAKIYLPFCLHCFQQVLACRSVLLQHYNVSFLSTDQLEELSLWKGTQSIPPQVMQLVLGKRRDQENVYCTFGLREIAEQEQIPAIPKHHVLEFANRLPNASVIRFIVLEPIPHNSVHPGQILGLSEIPVCGTPRTAKRSVSSRKLFVGPTVVTPETFGPPWSGADKSLVVDAAATNATNPLPVAGTKRRLAQSPTSVKAAHCLDDAPASTRVKRKLF